MGRGRGLGDLDEDREVARGDGGEEEGELTSSFARDRPEGVGAANHVKGESGWRLYGARSGHHDVLEVREGNRKVHGR